MGDPRYEYYVTSAMSWLMMMVCLTETAVLNMSIVPYVTAIREWLDELLANRNLDGVALYSAVERLSTAARRFDA